MGVTFVVGDKPLARLTELEAEITALKTSRWSARLRRMLHGTSQTKAHHREPRANRSRAVFTLKAGRGVVATSSRRTLRHRGQSVSKASGRQAVPLLHEAQLGRLSVVPDRGGVR